MIQYDKIRRLHIELSTRCNSVCPDCPRNLRGVEILENIEYPLTQLYLDDVMKILEPEFVRQLSIVLFNGNLGDFITARDALPIVEYLRSCNPSLEIQVSTNASGQPDIWETLGKMGIEVQFRLDGLADTHVLYRQNTSWDLIIANAKKFIAAGGSAIWAMIVFDHNRHQIESCRQISQDLGFAEFRLIDLEIGKRNVFPVFTRDKRLSHVVGDYQGPTDFNEIYENFQNSAVDLLGELDRLVTHRKISCKTMTINNSYLGQEIYITANGEIYPCCWTGFYPKYHARTYTNKQLFDIVSENNALVHGLEHSIKWFNKLVETWSIPTVQQGRILACNNECGHD